LAVDRCFGIRLFILSSIAPFAHLRLVKRDIPLPFHPVTIMTKLEELPSTVKRFPHILDSPSTLPSSLDPFTITISTGFLPLSTPSVTLPDFFQP